MQEKEKEKEKESQSPGQRGPTVLEFHAECLTCCTCRKSLLGESELRLGGKQGIIYCREHGEKEKGEALRVKGQPELGLAQDRLVKVCGRLPPLQPSAHRALPTAASTSPAATATQEKEGEEERAVERAAEDQ